MLLREPGRAATVGCWRQHPVSCNSPSRTARTCGQSYATAAGVLGCWKHRSALVHTACWRCWNRPARMLEPVIVSATTGDGHSDDRCCNRPAKMLEPAMAITTTGVAFCCDSEQQPVRMATTIFSYAGTSSLFCWNRRPNLLRWQATTGEDGDGDFLFFAGASLFCWNQLFVLLEWASQGAGTGEPLCPPPPEPDNPVLFVHCTRFLFYNAKTKLVLFA